MAGGESGNEEEQEPATTAQEPVTRASPFASRVIALVNGLPAMVAYWDLDQRCRVSNDAYNEWFGKSPAQMVGMHLRDLLGPRIYELNLPYITRALAGERQLFDRTLVDAHGRTRYTQASYIPDERDGEVRGFSVLVTEITERVEAERAVRLSAARYRALARSIPHGFVLLFDSSLRFLVAEGVELGTFGYAPEQLEGRTLHEAFPATLAADLEPRYRAALAGEEVRWEREVGPRTFQLTAAPIVSEGDDDRAGMVVATDITEQRRDDAERGALREIATAVARSAEPAEIAERVVASVTRIFGLEHATVLRFTGPGLAEIIAIAPPLPHAVSRTVDLTSEEALAVTQVAETGESAVSRYDRAHGEIEADLHARGLRFGAAAPIHVRGRIWGAIALGSPLPVDRILLDRLEHFAELVELAIGNSEAWGTLAQQAATDELTGLANRRAFLEHLQRAVANAARSGRPLSVVLLDIDHFKRVNDLHGHPVGDEVLAEVATRLQATVRVGDVAARLGGEEFAWLLPDATADDGWATAERARCSIADEPFRVVGRVTISAGVATLAAGQNVDDLLANADAALYDAKHSGRNTTVHHLATRG